MRPKGIFGGSEKGHLFPMLSEKLTEEEWHTIYTGCDEFGYMIDHVPNWKPNYLDEKKHKEPKTGKSNGTITLPSGHFTVEELTWMLNSLPFDITFVNKGDEVNYFTEGKERIFARTRTIVGRNVSNCHPPASVHIVEGIVEDFKNGKKDHEDFWLHMKDMFVYIRYFAVRNEKNEYLGVLEVTQNIAPIMELKGEKRLVD